MNSAAPHKPVVMKIIAVASSLILLCVFVLYRSGGIPFVTSTDESTTRAATPASEATGPSTVTLPGSKIGIIAVPDDLKIMRPTFPGSKSGPIVLPEDLDPQANTEPEVPPELEP